MQNNRRQILFFNWKDITHPEAGGAEVYTDALASHMAKTHDIKYFTSAYPGCKKEETYNGYIIIRRGNIYTVIFHAFLHWHRNIAESKKYECIIDQVHGVPFFSILYKSHPPVITIIHEVAGILWKNILPSPVWKIGLLAERLWVYLYRKETFIAVSDSTKKELERLGIPSSRIHIVQNFLPFSPPSNNKKSNIPTLLVLGRIAPVKQIQDAIAAYRIAKQSISNLRLTIVGKSEKKYYSYKKQILDQIADDPNISLHEDCTEEEKREYLKNAHLLIMTSQKEGYGIVILEAAAYGVPAIGYQVAGIQDAIIQNKTGILVPYRDVQALASAIHQISKAQQTHSKMSEEAFFHAKKQTKQATFAALQKIIQFAK